MKMNVIKHFIFDAVKSLKRNKTLSIASMATVAAALFVFGIFIMGLLTINSGLDQMGSELQSKIVLNDDISKEQDNQITEILQNIKGVTKVEYEDKLTALENTKKMLGEGSEQLLEGFEEENPMPASYIVTVSEPGYISDITHQLQGLEGIEQVKDVREVANILQSIMNSVKYVGLAIFFVLFVVSLFLIGNTIKLTVFSRRREIGIMKQVGATDWFIRWPFIIEGIIIGLVGSLMAIVILFTGYSVLFNKMVSTITIVRLIHPTYILTSMLGYFALAGIAIGIIGSVMSIRKFLNV